MTEKVWYSLRDAVYQKKYKIAIQLLKSNSALFTMRNSVGESVLHYLAVENDLEGVAWLHKNGFTIDTKNNLGSPVIFEVAQLGYKDLLLWFIKKGADLNAKDSEDNDIIKYLQGYNQEKMIQFINNNVRLTSHSS